MLELKLKQGNGKELLIRAALDRVFFCRASSKEGGHVSGKGL